MFINFISELGWEIFFFVCVAGYKHIIKVYKMARDKAKEYSKPKEKVKTSSEEFKPTTFSDNIPMSSDALLHKIKKEIIWLGIVPAEVRQQENMLNDNFYVILKYDGKAIRIILEKNVDEVSLRCILREALEKLRFAKKIDLTKKPKQKTLEDYLAERGMSRSGAAVGMHIQQMQIQQRALNESRLQSQLASLNAAEQRALNQVRQQGGY